ncbi:MAG: hypothetical protein B7X57_07010 [Erythrobacter sp. 34-65-8]|nr:MAG: hypothetical protein B7X57_07010 [Erythrobacter sp. 34-65-8]
MIALTDFLDSVFQAQAQTLEHFQFFLFAHGLARVDHAVEPPMATNEPVEIACHCALLHQD